MLTLLALLGLASAAPTQRYHGILIANDNLPRTVENGKSSFRQPPRNKKGMEVVTRDMTSWTAATDGGKPLYFTSRDIRRVESMLVRHTLPQLLTTLTPGGVVADGGDVPVHRGPSTVAAVEGAFRDTRCRIARLKHRKGSNCDGIVAPADAKLAGAVEDVVFVTFSGHGSAAGLFLYDAMMPTARFETLVESLEADLVVVMLDSCYGSGWDEGKRQTLVEPAADVPNVVQGHAGVAVFKSASTIPEASELGAGVLTHVLVSGLLGAADEDGDERVTFAELSDFFHVQTTRGGQFVGDAEAPGGNHQRVLFDRHAGVGGTVLTARRDLGGRLLVADEQGDVLAELNLTAKSSLRKPARLALPIPSDKPYSLYFLPIDDRGNTAGPVRQLVHQGNLTLDAFPEGDTAKGRFVNYLDRSQSERGLFAAHGLPLNSRKLGRQLSLELAVGYHPVPAFGRVEAHDINAASDTVGPDAEDSSRGLYEWMQVEDAATWNLLQAGVTSRYHPFTPVHLEARLLLDVSPDAQVESGASSLLLARALGGAGFSGHLGSRQWIGWVTAGGGKMVISTAPEGSDGDPVVDPTPWSLYASAGIIARRPAGGVSVGLAAYRDSVTVLRYGDVEDERVYTSFAATLGFEMGRWSF